MTLIQIRPPELSPARRTLRLALTLLERELDLAWVGRDLERSEPVVWVEDADGHVVADDEALTRLELLALAFGWEPTRDGSCLTLARSGVSRG